MLNRDHASATMAFRAGDLFTVFSQARSTTFRTRRKAIVDDLLLHASSNFFKRYAQTNAHIATFALDRCRTPRATAEERAEQISHTEAAAEEVFKIDIPASCTCPRDRAVAIIVVALRRIAQHVIRLVEFLEALFCIGILVHIRMKRACFFTERLLHFIFGCGLVHAENFIEILSHAVRSLSLYQESCKSDWAARTALIACS